VNPSVEMKPNAGSEKSWTWATTDYSNDGAASEETFAIKFRSEELAREFKRRHDEARALNGGEEAVAKVEAPKEAAVIAKKVVEAEVVETKEVEAPKVAAVIVKKLVESKEVETKKKEDVSFSFAFGSPTAVPFTGATFGSPSFEQLAPASFSSPESMSDPVMPSTKMFSPLQKMKEAKLVLPAALPVKKVVADETSVFYHTCTVYNSGSKDGSDWQKTVSDESVRVMQSPSALAAVYVPGEKRAAVAQVVPVSLRLVGEVDTFDEPLFVEEIASACGLEAESVHVLSVKPGSVLVDLQLESTLDLPGPDLLAYVTHLVDSSALKLPSFSILQAKVKPLAWPMLLIANPNDACSFLWRCRGEERLLRFRSPEVANELKGLLPEIVRESPALRIPAIMYTPATAGQWEQLTSGSLELWRPKKRTSKTRAARAFVTVQHIKHDVKWAELKPNPKDLCSLLWVPRDSSGARYLLRFKKEEDRAKFEVEYDRFSDWPESVRPDGLDAGLSALNEAPVPVVQPSEQITKKDVPKAAVKKAATGKAAFVKATSPKAVTPKPKATPVRRPVAVMPISNAPTFWSRAQGLAAFLSLILLLFVRIHLVRSYLPPHP
jgi:hypothetical protein